MLHPTWPSSRLFVGVAILLSLGASGAPAGPSSAAPVQDRFAIPATDDGLPGAGPIRRYDWFQQLWRERRSDWASAVEQDQTAPSSSWATRSRRAGAEASARRSPASKVANRGISGDTTRGVLLRLEEDVLALDPAAVVLLIGTNDLEEGATPEVVAGNLKLILAALEAARPADAHRAVPGVPELGDEEAAGGQDPGGQRAVPGRGEERSAGHVPRDLDAVRRRRAATRRPASSPTCCTRTRSATPSGPRRCGPIFATLRLLRDRRRTRSRRSRAS